VTLYSIMISYSKITLLFLLLLAPLSAREFHVATSGDDAAEGSSAHPLRSIQTAANQAGPGDIITVHEGTYRERIDPPRGGESEARRIIYQSAPGAKVAIKGSEIVKGWTKLEHDTWRVTLPNSFFGAFNPYADEIRGDWFKPKGRKHHTGAVYLKGHWLTEAAKAEEVLAPATKNPLWFATVDAESTTITGQFPDTDPNVEGIEINVRKAVFYPSQTGRNFITVRGFTLEHAATNWAPPTAEQVGLIGTHWSKGWIIENNSIRYSTCTGITLGKHGDKFDNTSADSAEGYVETIKRGLAAGWSKENIGGHVVRDNHVSHCEQAGIVGSLGAIFSTITGNDIHHIHVRQLFAGAEQAGIKIHAAIDTLISNNHIHHTNRGIWLDWMAQGTRVTGNLIHGTSPSDDLFVEVNHGPFLIDHNLFLSATSLSDQSQGGAYAHNIFAGKIIARADLGRKTPYHEAHSTKIAGLKNIKGGDVRFYNNLFLASAGFDTYDKSASPNAMAGNVFIKGAKPSRHEKSPLLLPDLDPAWSVSEKNEKWFLEINLSGISNPTGPLVTSELLEKTEVSAQPYVQPDGSSYQLDRDYTGAARSKKNPSPGPFESLPTGRQSIQVWPINGK